MGVHRHVRRSLARGASLGLVAHLALASAPAGATSPPSLIDCPPVPDAPRVTITPPLDWRTVLDEDGVVAGHVLVLPAEPGGMVVELGPRAFVTDVVAGRFVLGERDDERTTMALVDLRHACRVTDMSVTGLAFNVVLEPGARAVRFVRVDPLDRRPVGVYRRSMDSPAVVESLDEACTFDCAPSDTTAETAAVAPLVEPRPVPVYDGSQWPLNTVLTFRWQPGEAPPDWAREAIRAAAADASTTKGSRAASFQYDSAATDTVRYTTLGPTTCRYGIACASRDIPSWWTVRLRPHGTEFSWGVLRWCQRQDVDGCFDLERTMLHELGHIAGMAHPEDHGFRLGARKTVMHAIVPARPKAGSLQHAYGTCDVAALQLKFDVPGSGAAISDCLALDTRLTLSAGRTRVEPGESVRLTATLSIAARAEYERLAGNALRGRSVLLRYRPAGSSLSWSTVWMKDGSTNGTYVASIAPLADWDFQAVFRAPDDEGLRASSSGLVTVRVGACSSTCTSGGRDLR
jgi:hypothetical protein